MRNYKQLGEVSKYISLLMKLGTIMLTNIIVFFALGFYIDKIFSTNGFSIIIGLIFGLILGFILMFKEIKKMDVNDNELKS